jgi:hypothetical protein
MLSGPYLAPGHIFVSFSHWLGAGALAAAVVGRNRAPVVLLVACLAVPFRFFIPGQHPERYEFMGVAAALCVWYIPALQRRLSTERIAFLLVAGLCIDGLRPWNFSGHAAGFEWIPFVSMLNSPDWAPTLLVLFRKCAIYGTAVWAIARAGAGILGASVFTGVLLAALEMAQMFLPGRTAETTDPLLALILGVILLHFDHKFGADPGVGTALPKRQVAASPGLGEHEPAGVRTMPRGVPSAKNGRPASSGVWTGGRRPGL